MENITVTQKVPSRKEVKKALFFTACFNTIIAIFLTVIKFGPGEEISGFLKNFLFSQCIGLSCCIFITSLQNRIKPGNWASHIIIDISGMILGVVFGITIGSFLTGINLSFFFQNYSFFIQILFGASLAASAIHYIFSTKEKASEAEKLAQEERIKRLVMEKEKAETDLKLLQAQIEPHFLFNTLSNILSLLDTDKSKGKAMLENLTHYLRTSLSKTREDSSTLDQEIDLIREYLNIFKVRMGERLNYRIEIPDQLKFISFPPMLIQPLVENSIKHGLEPKIEGGEIFIGAFINGELLVIEITDTGLGFHNKNDQGFGIRNIRDRLMSIFGEGARLILEENNPSGIKAIIEVPYVSD